MQKNTVIAVTIITAPESRYAPGSANKKPNTKAAKAADIILI